MIFLQVFVFNKTYHVVLRDSGLMHPESAPSVHSRVNLLKYTSMRAVPTILLNRTKQKYRDMKLKIYEKSIWMIELAAIYLVGSKGSLLAHPESALRVHLRLHLLWYD